MLRFLYAKLQTPHGLRKLHGQVYIANRLRRDFLTFGAVFDALDDTQTHIHAIQIAHAFLSKQNVHLSINTNTS